MKRMATLWFGALCSAMATAQTCNPSLGQQVGNAYVSTFDCPDGGSEAVTYENVIFDPNLPPNAFGGRTEYDAKIQDSQCRIGSVFISSSLITGHVLDFEGIKDSATCADLPSRPTDPVSPGLFGGSLAGSATINGKAVSGSSAFSLRYGMPMALTAIGTSRHLDLGLGTPYALTMRMAETALRAAGALGPNAIPETGWWWNPAESGRGFSIEVASGKLFMASYLYRPNGSATWWASGGPLNPDNSYTGELLEYRGGQTLSGPYRPASVSEMQTYVGLTCSTPTSCVLRWAGGEMSIQRFRFSASPTTSSPEAGWWWNPDESGRGYFLERQGTLLFAASYMYTASGDAIWYLASGNFSGTTFNGSWSQYGNGQTINGSFAQPQVLNPNVGPVSIRVTSPSSATLTLPGGTQIPIRRFRF